MWGEADPRAQPAGAAARASRPSQEGTGTTTRRVRWDQLRRYLWQPPRPHGEQPAERVVGPLELFYDLAVVVLVAQSAHHLAGHLTWRGLGEFTVVFTLVWIAWTNGSLHHELHGHDDARARSTFLLQILVLVAMGAFIPEAGGARGAAFAVAAGVLFAILAVLWLLAARGDRPDYRRSSRLFVAGTAACAVALTATSFLPASTRMVAWGLLDLAYLAGFAAVILTASFGPALIVTDALIERFGLLTIIVLGETLIGVVTGLADEPLSALTPQRRAGRRRSRLRRLVDILRLRRTPPPQTEPGGERAMDVQPSASYGSHSRHGRGHGQPHSSRTRRPHARCHSLDAERRRGRRAMRDDARIRKPASLAARPALSPARRPSLRRCCGNMPRRRSGPARATRSWPRSHRAAQHPVGSRRRAPSG
jgi:hypothetical protein